jgi:histidine phosphotransferase ChpT
MREIGAQFNLTEVDHHLACMFKIHRDAISDARLHLPQPPLGLLRMTHHHAGLQKIAHDFPFPSLPRRTFPVTDKLDLAALVGSRICHDLISPIGAIGNGVELISMEGSVKGPEMLLISESVAHANARIRFFRIAFGASGQDQRIGRPEVASVLSDISNGSRVQIDWDSPNDLPRRDVKLVFLLMLCLEAALPFGGKIRVERNDQRWLLQASSAKLRADPALWERLINPAAAAEIGAAQVQFALVPEEIKRQHRRLTTEIGETEIRLSF